MFLQIGNLDGYYHFHLARNIGHHKDVPLVGKSLGNTISLPLTALGSSQHQLTYTLDNDEIVSISLKTEKWLPISALVSVG